MVVIVVVRMIVVVRVIVVMVMVMIMVMMRMIVIVVMIVMVVRVIMVVIVFGTSRQTGLFDRRQELVLRDFLVGDLRALDDVVDDLVFEQRCTSKSIACGFSR